MNTLIKLADPNAIAKQMAVKAQLRKGVLGTGYHFCHDCERVTANLETDLLFRCCWCGGHSVQHYSGV